jgi:hypothetical protein
MSDNIELVPISTSRSAVTGLQLPVPPPTRIYISGHEYKIGPPKVILPPIVDVARLVLNWVGPAARKAVNVLFAKMAGGTGSTSDPAWLTTLATGVFQSMIDSGLLLDLATTWKLSSVVAKDAGGTSAQGISTQSPTAGSNINPSLPPQSCVVLSWRIAPAYRGGKPRTYLPGIPDSAVVSHGDSALTTTFTTAIQADAATFRSHVNALTPESSSITLGNVSYFHSHAVRPTPIFNPFMSVNVHERLDSQRRRSGKESSFGELP